MNVKDMDQTPWEQIQLKLRNPDGPPNDTLKNWLAHDPENQILFDEMKMIYHISGNIPETFEPKKEIAWYKIMSRIGLPKRSRKLFQTFSRVAAAILLVASGVGGTYLFQAPQPENSFTEVFSPYGHKTLVLLPDSSQVWLNGNSRIRYNTNFANGREIQLTGEALFQVTKNPDKLFTVVTPDLQLEVYGTTFNLKSYNDDSTSEIALLEGSIGLKHDKAFLKKMIPGEIITYHKDEMSFDSQEGNLDQITSWKADELIIENQTFESVTKYLERWYGVEITLDESLKQKNNLSFKVKTESLTELLSIIDHIIPINYEINGKKVNLSKNINKKK